MCDNCECSHLHDYGACDTFELGRNGRCVYCDHARECHPGNGDAHNGPLGPVARRGIRLVLARFRRWWSFQWWA